MCSLAVVMAAISGQATYQDVDSHSTDFFFTAPISKFQYLAGRFLGALAIQVLIFSGVGIGAWVATRMPWIDPTRVGPQIIAAYFQPYFTLVLPNLILLTAIFFALAALGKKMLPVYAGSVILLIGYFVANQLSTNLTVSVLSALADPLGGNAVDRLAQYWTPFQRNTQLIPFTHLGERLAHQVASRGGTAVAPVGRSARRVLRSFSRSRQLHFL
jgi:ABC-2 type transport system permease protein